ncbi:hypothetical protein PM082_012832 [Marasmius tenuissimus]|nr:hypothetical protein PM082_012832 [Marasmius tenuissimus]
MSVHEPETPERPPTTPNGQVGIFWDYENCSVPSHVSGYSLVNSIFEVAQQFGSIKTFRSYANFSEMDSSPSIDSRRSELQSSGVSLIDCPHNGRKEVVDQMLLIDMMAFAMDTPTPRTIILISSDKDFAYALATLRYRHTHTVLISQPRKAHVSLTAQASTYLDWSTDILSNLKEEHRRIDNETSGLSGTEAGNDTTKSFKFHRRNRTVSFERPKLKSGTSPRKSASTTLTDNDESDSETASKVANASSATVAPQIGSPARIPKEISPPGSPSQQPQSIAISGPDDSEYEEPRAISSTAALPPSPGSSRLFSSFSSTTTFPSAFRKHRTSGASAALSSSKGFSASTWRQPLDDPSVPVDFQTLMRILQNCLLEGENKPLRSSVSRELKIQNPNFKAYKTVLISEFNDYIELAMSKGLVVLGGEGATSWISLHPNQRLGR